MVAGASVYGSRSFVFPDWMEKKGRELVMKGKGFMLLGVLLVAAAIGLSIYNVYSDEHAES